MSEKEVTCKGLEKWFVKMFEKLGWIVICMDEGSNHKVQCYAKSLDNLVGALQTKIGQVQDPDKKADLQIMLRKAQKLQNHFEKDVMRARGASQPQQMGGKRRSRKRSRSSSRGKKYM